MNVTKHTAKGSGFSAARTIAALTLLLLGASSCSHQAVRPGGESAGPSSTLTPLEQLAQGTMGPEAPVGPLPAPGYVPPQDGYVLVLGPGLARAMAYVGVLRELESRNVLIRGVVGVEMGAVVSGIWASSNLNNLEWQMHKLKRETLLDVPVFGLGTRVAEGKKLYDFLDDALKVNQLQQMRVQAVIASAVLSTDTILTESNGSAKDIIRGAMGIPGIIKPYTWDAKERETAALEQPFPVAAAKSLAVGKAVCVDVIGRGDNFHPREAVDSQVASLMRAVGALARQQLKDCDSVITVPMDDVGYLDFESKADLISRGRAAAKKWLEPTP